MLTHKELGGFECGEDWQQMETRSAASATALPDDRQLSVNEEINSVFLNDNPFGILRIELREPLDKSLPKNQQAAHLLTQGYLAQHNRAFANQHQDVDLSLFQNSFPAFLFDDAKQFLNRFVEANYQLINFPIAAAKPEVNKQQCLADIFGAVENNHLLRIWGTLRPSAASAVEAKSLDVSLDALDALHEHIAVIDDKGVILAVNTAWTQFACQNGLATHNLSKVSAGVNYLEICRQAEDSGEIYQGIKNVLSGVSPSFTLEYPCHSPTEARWFLLVASPLRTGGGAVIAHFDVTERKLAEIALEESRKRFQQLTDNIEAVFWVYNTNTRQTEYLSPVFERLWGYSIEPLKTQNERWLKVIHSEDVESYQKALSNLNLTDTFEIEYRITAGNGQTRWIRDKGFAGRGEHDNHRITVIREDFTARRSMEQEREEIFAKMHQAYSEAEAANRLRDEFLGTISHELRTPLTSLVGWTQMLLSEQLDEQTVRRGLESINRSANAQTQLIEDLLDVSRIIRGKLKIEPKLINIEPVIELAVESIRKSAAAKNIEIECVSNLESSVIHADPRRLQQILWNLLTNAIKFTPKKGRIEISLENTGGFTEISVRDTGIGVAPDVLPTIFNRFTQADGKTTRRFGGLGLGLAIVRHLTELHGGTVEAASAGENQGSLFTVRFPAAPLKDDSAIELDREIAVASNIVAAQDFRQAPRLEGVRLLLVDDDRDNLEWLAILFDKFGAKVETASSAAEAVTKYLPFKPDLIISDIGMPDEDGYSLIKRIRELAAHGGEQKPAIALTAFTKTEDTKHALAAGFQKHLKKPVAPVELLNQINDLLQSWQRRESTAGL